MKHHERSLPADVDLVPTSKRRCLSFSHSDLNNPDHVADLYEQCLDQVLSGLHPVSRDTAIRLAAIHCFIQFGPYHDGVEHSIRAYNLIPKEYTHGKNVHSREHEKNIIEQYRNLSFADALAAKRKYCDICSNLPTYGTIFFEVKEPLGNKLVPRLFGVNKECVMCVDKKSKVVQKSWPLEQLRRWAASPTTFNIDFGDYKDGYYSVQTAEGEKIKLLIAEFVDIIIWKKKIVDPFGLEGDEGAIMIEDFVLRARSVPLSLGDVVGEEEPLIKQNQPIVSSPFMLPLNRQPTRQFPRRISTSSSTFPPATDQQQPPTPIRTVSAPQQQLQPPKAQMPPGFEQYDQLPFQQAPPIPPNATQILHLAPSVPPPTTQIQNREEILHLSQPPFMPSPQKQPTLSQLPQQMPQPPTSSTPPPPPQAVSPPVGHTLPPSLTSSMQQRCQSTVGPASMSILTEQEIVYEISIKNGQCQRSFEQFYSQSRNLQGLSNAVEQSERRVRESATNLGTKPIGRLTLTEEQRLMAIQLGEDTIRHRAVVFLACTAQVIEWSSEYQLHPKYGHAQVAVVQATDNLCELVQCFLELCAIRQDADFSIVQCSPLVLSLCNAFNEFLAKLHPEKSEKRSAFLSSASLVGECSFGLLNALNDEEEAMEDQHFYLAMNEAIQRVADGTANLVMQAKNLPALPGDSHNERVIEAATMVALFTSELIALARVLASIMAHPACQKRLQEAVERVRAATAELIERAKVSVFNHFATTGSAENYAQIQKTALIAEMALGQMLEQTKA